MIKRSPFLILKLFLIWGALLLPLSSLALSTSDRAFRLEDNKGNALLGADQASLEKGEIYHTIVLLWGKLEVFGEVDEVVILSGHVTFHEGSQLHKSLVVMGGGTFESLPGADLKSENVIAQAPSLAWRMLQAAATFWRDNIDWAIRILAGVITTLLLWGVGWGVFRVLPALQAATADSLFRNLGKNLLLGILGSFGACIIFVLLLISVVGIVLIPLYLLLLACGGLLSYLAAALWAGHRLLPPRPGKKLNPFGFLLGLLVFQLLWSIPVFWASLPVWLLWTLAWGTIVRSLRLLWR